MTEHKHAAILRAIADGRPVQVRDGNSRWIDFNPDFHFPPAPNDDVTRWRIKPRTPRRIWVNEFKGGIWSGYHSTREVADINGKGRIACIEFLEVLPDE